MIVYVDIDETICKTPESRDYSLAVPMKDRIKTINNFKNEKILYFNPDSDGHAPLVRVVVLALFAPANLADEPIYPLAAVALVLLDEAEDVVPRAREDTAPARGTRA